jgi:hypothetical protein
MTAPNGAIIFNADSGGSDTAASGLGPTTAVSGTGASTTASNATVDLSADTPDLSGVSAGDLMWVDSSSGRQFSIIASVDDGADTVTCDDTFANTEGSRNWGIGGKRSTFDNADSRNVFSDFKDDWVVETESDQTISTTALVIDASVTGEAFILRGSSGGIKTITQSSQVATIEIDGSAVKHVILDNVKIENSATTNSSCLGVHIIGGASLNGLTIKNSQLGDTTNTLYEALRGSNNELPGRLIVAKSVVRDCTNNGIFIDGFSGQAIKAIHSTFLDNSGTGFYCNYAQAAHALVNNVFIGNGDGARLAFTAGTPLVLGNTFSDNSSDGFVIGSVAANTQLIFANNIFSGNGGYGIAGTDTDIHDGGRTATFYDSNLFNGNTSGDVQETDLGTGDNVVTSAPDFVATGSNDYSLNSTSPAKAAGVGLHPDSPTDSFVDIGGSQREEPTDGTVILRPTYTM